MNKEMNFRCTVTGKEFLIDQYKAKVNTITGQLEYFQSGPGWRHLKNPETGGCTLEKIVPSEINMTSVHTETTVSK